MPITAGASNAFLGGSCRIGQPGTDEHRSLQERTGSWQKIWFRTYRFPSPRCFRHQSLCVFGYDATRVADLPEASEPSLTSAAGLSARFACRGPKSSVCESPSGYGSLRIRVPALLGTQTGGPYFRELALCDSAKHPDRLIEEWPLPRKKQAFGLEELEAAWGRVRRGGFRLWGSRGGCRSRGPSGPFSLRCVLC